MAEESNRYISYGSKDFIDLQALRREAANEDQTEVKQPSEEVSASNCPDTDNIHVEQGAVNQTSREVLAPNSHHVDDNCAYGQIEQGKVKQTSHEVLGPNTHDADDHGGYGRGEHGAASGASHYTEGSNSRDYRTLRTEYDKLRRNYNDVVSALTKRDAESQAFLESRDRLQNDLDRLSLKHEELTRQHNDNKLADKEKLQKLRQDNADLIAQHTQQIEIIKEQRNQLRDKNRRLIQLIAELNEKRKSVYTGEEVNTHEDEPKPDHDHTDDRGPTSYPVAKRPRFISVPCERPQCKNCGMVFSRDRDPKRGSCHFHMTEPQPYHVWRRNADAEEKDRRCLYWPCCHVYSRRNPIGCRSLKHHDVIEYL